MCPDCQTAATERHHGFHSGCMGCRARAFSRGPYFWQVAQAQRLNGNYLQQLERLGITHEQVKQAYNNDALNLNRAQSKG